MNLLRLRGSSAKNRSAGADMVLGACAGYPAQTIRPFVESLRRWYEGDVVLVSAHLPPDAKHLLRQHRIEEVEIALDHPCSNIQLRRYFTYREILQARPNIARAMLVDVRDVFFQDGPFVLLPDDPLIAFLEDEKIGNCAVNTRWIERIYGPDRAAQLAGCTISCSGTTAGTRAGLLRYLNSMCCEIDAVAPKRLIGGDQGIHNHLLNGAFPEAVFVPNRTGAVQSLHYQKIFTFDSFGRILNRDRRVCPVVHQLDRYPQFFPLWRSLLEDTEGDTARMAAAE